ncbi:MAG: BatA and WFA domain-containing protein [Candidatus Kapabacteria bacterium]|nr:BatA and WFA domain-containing protein [Ignavibacteriota bacterium]MCW5886187.1 BatA and WFA domain-containing protein [Candidatus Kapabacteria bacterium]
MNFLNPLVLIGLFAAAIPVLLHLLNLRKLKTVEFSSLKFLKELQKTQIRKLKLKQILLLILRTLLIIFAVLAFARPTIPGSIPYFESYAKTSAVIIIDNSFSMDISDEFGSRFNQAKTAAANIIKNFSDGDEVAVLSMSGEKYAAPSYSRNFDYILQQINSIKISNIPANLNQSLRFASALASDASNLNKEIYIISDAQSNIFDIINNDTVRLQSVFTSAVIVPVGLNSKADLQNLSIDSVSLISSIFEQDKQVETEVFIRNGSKNTIKDVVVSLEFDNKPVAQRSADIASGETISFLIAAAPSKSGPIKATARLENDIQNLDNYRYFGFNIPPKPRLLICGNNTFGSFLGIALSTFYKDENINNLIFTNSNQLSSEDFINYDAIIIADGNISKANLSRIKQYIFAGGSVLMFANEDTDFKDLSYFLKEVGIGAIKKRNFSANEPAEFQNVDKSHPVFDGVFDDKPGISQIESPRIYKSMPAESGLALISMPGGAFLSEARKNDGKILYIAVSQENDWSTLPLTGIYPTLIYRSVLYLTSSEDKSVDIKSGESLIFRIPNRFQNSSDFKIVDPNGNEFFHSAVSLPQGKVISFENLIIPGVYFVLDESDKYVAQIAVNIDETESLLLPLNKENIKSELSERLPETNIEIEDNIQQLAAGISRIRTGTELWQIFILLALIAAISEMIVQRVSKNEVSA